jgi:hypothetical protein
MVSTVSHSINPLLLIITLNRCFKIVVSLNMHSMNYSPRSNYKVSMSERKRHKVQNKSVMMMMMMMMMTMTTTIIIII